MGRGGALVKYHMARILAELGWRVDVLTTGKSRGMLIRQVVDSSAFDDISGRIRSFAYTPPPLGPIPELLYLAGTWVCPQQIWAKGWGRKFEQIVPAVLPSRSLPPGPLRDQDEMRGTVVLASFPSASNLILGETLADRYRLPLYLDFRDEFSGTRSREKSARWLAKAQDLESRVVAKAAHVFVTSQTVAENLKERYGLGGDRCTVVLNGIFASESEAAEVNRLRESRPRTNFRLVWLGTMSQHQQPETLIEGFQRWRRVAPAFADAELLIVCNRSLYFSRKIRRRLGEGVRWIDYVPRDRVPDVVADCDVGCLALGGELYGYALPTKLFDYLHFGLPMLGVLPPGEASSLIRREGWGEIVEVGDAASVASAIDRLSDVAARAAIRERMEASRNQFLFETQVKQISEVLVGGKPA